MKKEVLNMKKFFSILLAALMLLAIVPAYGIVAEEAHIEAAQDHSHVVPHSGTTTVRRGWTYHNADYHVPKYMHTGICSTCHETVTWFTKGAYPATAEEHNYRFDSATCDGKMQTHVYECGPCLHRRYVDVICPGGPHSGVCGYLPR